VFYAEAQNAVNTGTEPPQGNLVNPIYLPAPHQVATALVTAFTTPPAQADAPWFHQSLWHSIKIVFSAFFIASLVGIPLGILCGFSNKISQLTEPFVEFFRYLPAPAFGALAVAILGINDAPKIAIIVIGTLFQQILIIANTTRMVDRGLIEAGYTLGTNKAKSLFHVVIPAALPDIYRDLRVLLGWAWTYLIVSELIGTTTGITWFITQQARYQNFDNVYAAILIIGVIGLVCDVILMKLGQHLFKWKAGAK
jgi:NitT/TauT family transport system permease protein